MLLDRDIFRGTVVEDRAIRGLIWATMIVLVLRASVAIACQTYLYYDGAPYLYWLLADPRPMTWDFSRRFAHLLTQLPIVTGIHAGITDVGVLSRLFGLGLYFPFFAGLFTCVWISRKRPQYAIVPLLSGAAVTSNSSFFIISESHQLVALFWPLVMLLTLRQVWSRRTFALAAVFALPTLLCYESMALMGPILAGLAVWRGLKARKAGDLPRQAGFAGLAFYFTMGVIIGVFWIIHPRDPANFRMFISAFFFYRDGAGHWHLPGLLSLVAIALVSLALLSSWISGRTGRVVLAIFAIACVPVALAPWLLVDSFTPDLDARARVLNAYLPPLLALLFLLILYRRPTREQFRFAFGVVALLAATQGVWHTLAAKRWGDYLDIFREDLTTHVGLVPFNSTRLALAESRGRPVRVMNSEWTLPVMSLLLAPDGRVRTIIANRDPNHWQPFDPSHPEKFRDLSRYGIRFDDYVKAMRAPVQH